METDVTKLEGMIGYDNRSLAYIDEVIQLMILNMDVNRENQVLLESPFMTAFLKGFKSDKMPNGKLIKKKSSAPIREYMEVDKSINIKRIENPTDLISAQLQGDEKSAYYVFNMITDSVVLAQTEIDKLQNGNSVDDYIKRKARKLMEGVPERIAACLLDETLAAGDQVLDGISSYITTSDTTVGGLNQATETNADGIYYWRNQRATSSKWTTNGSITAKKLLRLCNKYKGGKIDLIFSNGSAWDAYEKEIATYGTSAMSGITAKMQGLNLEVLQLRGRPVIYDPNFVIASDETAGKWFMINSDQLMPATVEKTMNLDKSGMKEAVKTWLGYTNPMRRTAPLAKTWVKDTEVYLTIVAKSLIKQGVLSITDVS